MLGHHVKPPHDGLTQKSAARKGDAKWLKIIRKTSRTVQSATTGEEVVKLTHSVNESLLILPVPKENVCFRVALGKVKTSRPATHATNGRPGVP